MYETDLWQKIPGYGEFMLKQGRDGHTSFAPLFMDFLYHVKPGESVLDVACGAGTMAILVEQERLPIEYVGVDITPCHNTGSWTGTPVHFRSMTRASIMCSQ
jgi:tRNA1(Val) A37 N6-methylase TrmN6